MPLANDARPLSFDDMVGQTHLVGTHGILRKMAETDNLTSCIFYGPPGCGKTTAALILAHTSSLPTVMLNATNCSVKDIQKAVTDNPNGVLIYLDEVQYFNRKQQQSLLPYVENGNAVLIAATTENPYHGVYKALVSRCLIAEFMPISTNDILQRLKSVLEKDNLINNFSDDAIRTISRFAAGDMRKAFQATEIALSVQSTSQITSEDLDKILPHTNMGSFDTDGDQHYRYKSALQKSIRGSDADAAVFWLNQLLEGGDILSPIRRMLVIAYEDIGLADPMAPSVVLDACTAAERLGLPEARYPLTYAAIYLATAPKSNSVGQAFKSSMDLIHSGHGNIVPAHIAEECAHGYLYPHNFPNHWVYQQYLPNDLVGQTIYTPGFNQFEQGRAHYWNQIKNQTENTKN